MFCKNCGAPLNEGTRFCIHCGKEVTAAPPQTPQASVPPQAPVVTQAPPPVRQTADEAVKPAPKSPKGRYWLFGAAGTAVGALLLAVILFAAGVLSFGGAVSTGGIGGKIEGPGFDTPEDAAKAYLNGLKNQDMDAMLSAFAVESYVEHYDLEAMVDRIRVYMPFGLEIRLPGNTDYSRRLNLATRVSQIEGNIFTQFLYYNAPDAFNDGAPVTLTEAGDVSDFMDKLERSTEDYVFADLEIGDVVDPEDVSDQYMTAANQENIAKQAKTFGVDEDDVANIAITFEAGGYDCIFCPQAVRYNDKWYLQSLQGNLAILANMSVYTGGIAPIDDVNLP